MKSVYILALTGALLFGCQQKQSETAATVTTAIHASSMVCGSCAKNVENALTKVEGVREVSVDLKTKMVQVKYTPEKTNVQSLETAVSNAGYDANEKKRNPEAYEKLDNCCKIDG